MEVEESNKITKFETFALAVAAVAPTGSIAFNAVPAVPFAGMNVPLSFLLGAIGLLFVGICFAELSKHVADVGSVYAYNQQAFGEKMGLVSGWTLMFAYINLAISCMGADTNFTHVFFLQFGWHLPEPLLAAVILVAAALVLTFGLKLTSKSAIAIEFLAIAILVALSIIIFVKGGRGGVSVQPFVPTHSSLSGLGQGMVFAVLSFCGFEGVTTVAARTKNPKRSVPLSIIVTIIFAGIFFVVASYVQVIGFGIHHTADFANSSSPLNDLALMYMGRPMALVMDFAIVIGSFGSVLGIMNAGAYMIYAMGVNQYLPKKLGKFNEKLNSPARSIWLLTAIMAVAYLIFGVPYGAEVIYDNSSTLGVLSMLTVYGLTCAGTMLYFHKHRDTIKHSFIKHVLIPVLGILVLLYPMWTNLYPVPAFPGNLYPYLVVLWIIIGLVVYGFKKHATK
ncbi:APC family permease [Apilactobacillus bombintestini]|uniref:APC family permease n=1 Tax=Apilactobacillus bombintestini TaxID=2419772 RepID=A0A387B1P1_9LACO|nr:APC family permease [Apilactobacillus bombintestini]AYF93060.1 APC family permease [Apilactobacillus bombintestini]